MTAHQPTDWNDEQSTCGTNTLGGKCEPIKRCRKKMKSKFERTKETSENIKISMTIRSSALYLNFALLTKHNVRFMTVDHVDLIKVNGMTVLLTADDHEDGGKERLHTGVTAVSIYFCYRRFVTPWQLSRRGIGCQNKQNSNYFSTSSHHTHTQSRAAAHPSPRYTACNSGWKSNSKFIR